MRRLLEQRLERPQAEHFVEHFFDDSVLLGGGHGHALVVQQALHHAADLGAHAVLGDRGDALQVQHADQLAMNFALEFENTVGGANRRQVEWPRGWRLRTEVTAQEVPSSRGF